MRTMRRRLLKGVKVYMIAAIRIIWRGGRPSQAEQQARIEHLRLTRCTTRAQWRRWYQANTKRQRQLRAYKRLTGAKINPLAHLPRWAVP